jgi:hypothetical protein
MSVTEDKGWAFLFADDPKEEKETKNEETWDFLFADDPKEEEEPEKEEETMNEEANEEEEEPWQNIFLRDAWAWWQESQERSWIDDIGDPMYWTF